MNINVFRRRKIETTSDITPDNMYGGMHNVEFENKEFNMVNNNIEEDNYNEEEDPY